MKKLGAAPSSEVPDTARHRALSAASRVRMLDLARRAGEAGLTAADVAAATGLHPSTVRAHLDQLTESGLVTRNRQGDGTPGRPAWRYYATDTDPHAVAPPADPGYRELAGALVAHLARDADDPHAAGVRAGRDWGRALATPRSEHRSEVRARSAAQRNERSLRSEQKAPQAAAPAGRSAARPEPLDGLVRVLDTMGFTPELVERPAPGNAAWETVVALRSCPFLDLALANPDVVCGVHEGVIEGALGALGATNVDTDLQPFAEPGACLVRVHMRQTKSSRTRDGGR